MAFLTSDIAEFQVSKEEKSTLGMFQNFVITYPFLFGFQKVRLPVKILFGEKFKDDFELIDRHFFPTKIGHREVWRGNSKEEI